LVIGLFVLLTCDSHRRDRVYIRNYIKECSSDLIKSQLDKKVRTKEYEFEGQSFIMTIDTTGKPIFLDDTEYTESINLNYDDENYSVTLENGIITVDVE
jgi:hypothetical protein